MKYKPALPWFIAGGSTALITALVAGIVYWLRRRPRVEELDLGEAELERDRLEKTLAALRMLRENVTDPVLGAFTTFVHTRLEQARAALQPHLDRLRDADALEESGQVDEPSSAQ